MTGVKTESMLVADPVDQNIELAYRAIQAAVDCGVREFCLCPGVRNAPFLGFFKQSTELKVYYWYEERSAAFFALGRSKALQQPTAVITTSGSAAGELLPAAMEAYYSGIPLLMITADRPRRFRGSGGPQVAEQVGLFGIYASYQLDVEASDDCNLISWKQENPAHMNVCFEEPTRKITCQGYSIVTNQSQKKLEEKRQDPKIHLELNHFLSSVKNPLVIVSALKREAREPVARFLRNLNAPAVLEGVSGLREEPSLQHLRILRLENVWRHAETANYPLDGVLRIGGVPTLRLWRDLEDKNGAVKVCSITEVPFSGLSWKKSTPTSISDFFTGYKLQHRKDHIAAMQWISSENDYSHKLNLLFEEEPTAEASLIHQLSKLIPENAQVFLGNSLPIREWDIAADNKLQHTEVYASRGINGIDGQISTCLGLGRPGVPLWGIFGDLTTLYDMAGPWILSQLKEIDFTMVVINNGGGMIFDRMFGEKLMLNEHRVNFEPLAKLWSMNYEKWTSIPVNYTSKGNCLIEIVPDNNATKRFSDKTSKI